MRALLQTDGGARGNPGPAGIGVVLRSSDGSLVLEEARALGETTNNVAEYTALITGLELALEHGVDQIDVRVDSQLVVAQLKGDWKIKSDRLRTLAVKARRLLDRFDEWTLNHVGRADNADADRLANEAMDAAGRDQAYAATSLEQQGFFDPRS